MPSVLSLKSHEAKTYFLEASNYSSLDLPDYYNFEDILSNTVSYIGNKGIHELFETVTENGKKVKINPADIDGVNYRLISNKDGEFGWRPLELIHPALYVALVNEITAPNNWTLILERFNQFKKAGVKCESIPFVSDDSEKNKAHQIRRWWEHVEQAGVKVSLEYNYVFDVDIADCYGSIYTHAIAWALHGKQEMKQKRDNGDYIGNRIDSLIRKMRYGQTNGIPQGSTLMDFIAEMLLGYIDTLVISKLDSLGTSKASYKIIRFRDDYKIYTNNPELGRDIVKELSLVLSSMGMKLNTAKTKQQSDAILASVKLDKLYELFIPNNRMSMSKRLMQIYESSNKFPNSGLITRQMNDFYRHLAKTNKLGPYDDVDVMISIVTNLAIKNPKSYQWCMAVLSHLLGLCEEEDRPKVIENIRRKFKSVPYTGILDIWLQRISYPIDSTISFEESLARIASGEYLTNLIWDSSWLEPGLASIVRNTSIIKKKVRDDMPLQISASEVALFSFPNY